jgi:hypothetical protein
VGYERCFWLIAKRLGKAYRFGPWRAGVAVDRPAEKAMIARQATEWANEKGLEKS